ncbi:MAG: asparagine synthase (glutamine-hydrolyzing) [Saprospiraceae bacterium]|nr:asparagine synthase (glutamine-hydrolyzing) [Saprospiraceae bacterium]
MCRISGIWTKNPVDIVKMTELAQSMINTLEHGGPDDSGLYVNNNIALGHKRLSIIDLSASGHQPYIWDKYVMVYNGEIYNYEEIRNELIELGYEFISHSDTEVIIKSFDQWGLKFVDRFRGMFALAIWNTQEQTLTVCRDRIGVKPLYWYHKDGVFVFASELKALHQHPGFDKTIDQDAVDLYLQTGYIRSPYCIFKYAKKLVPGSILQINRHGDISIHTYWNIDVKAREAKTLTTGDEATIRKTEEILTEGFRLRMVADVPVGIFLSGGIDSSLVTALLQKDRDMPLNTYTIGFEDKVYDESPYAEKVANILGTNHHTFTCSLNDFARITDRLSDIYDEPFGDSSAIPTTMVAEEARRHVKVALSADAGDELFSGYERYMLANRYYDKISAFPLGLRNMAASIGSKIPPSSLQKIADLLPFMPKINHFEIRYPKMLRALRSKSRIEFLSLVTSGVTIEALEQLHKGNHTDIFEMPTPLEQKRQLSEFTVADSRSYLEGDIMTKVDRATMSVALEAREPFLDHKIIEYALALPDHFKIRNNQSKWVLRQILYKYVPSDLIDRRKQGFGIPFALWLKTTYASEVRNLALDEKFMATFQLNAEFVRTECNLFLNNRTGILEQGVFWYLFVLYKWYLRWLN